MKRIIERSTAAAGWLGFFALVLLAWMLLFLMQPGAVDSGLLQDYGSRFWSAICAPVSGQAGFWSVLFMWMLMSAAMMAPTFVPNLRTYADLGHAGAAGQAGLVALLAGYLAIWGGFSALAAMAQLWLARAGLIGAGGASLSWGLSGALLLFAGLYQFTALKKSCLSKCRAPLMYFIGHWRGGVQGALWMGAELGLVCLGCCWALMLLGFVGGVMNLAWMGIATLLMALEKLPEIGRVVTRPLGAVLVLAGVFATLQASMGI
ncbi:MAG: DUF2182 domain-containing protein [Rhodobacteraceae bacterium]|nr:DUF2182 domain-containing protein [Paracoccaceae bacterium]